MLNEIYDVEGVYVLIPLNKKLVGSSYTEEKGAANSSNMF